MTVARLWRVGSKDYTVGTWNLPRSYLTTLFVTVQIFKTLFAARQREGWGGYHNPVYAEVLR
jgi:hypothetical protein